VEVYGLPPGTTMQRKTKKKLYLLLIFSPSSWSNNSNSKCWILVPSTNTMSDSTAHHSAFMMDWTHVRFYESTPYIPPNLTFRTKSWSNIGNINHE
jgi:hypothetical protein